MKLIKTDFLFVNVEDAPHITLGDFEVQMPSTPMDKNMQYRLYIKKAIIPYNWESIIATTDTFSVGATDYTLTHGNPTVLDLATEINTLQSSVKATFNTVRSRFSFSNLTAAPVTLTTTAIKQLGFSSLTIASGASEESTQIVDVRPDPIVEMRVSVPTAGQEMYQEELRDTNVLSAIGMNVPMYGIQIWRDNGLYWAPLLADGSIIRFQMTNTEGLPIVPQTSPYFVIGVEHWLDEEAEILHTQNEQLRLTKYDMLLKHGDTLDNPTLD